MNCFSIRTTLGIHILQADTWTAQVTNFIIALSFGMLLLFTNWCFFLFFFHCHLIVSTVYWILIFPLVTWLVHVLLTLPQRLRQPGLFNWVNVAHLWCSVFVHLNLCLSLFLFTFCPGGCFPEIVIFVLRALIFLPFFNNLTIIHKNYSYWHIKLPKWYIHVHKLTMYIFRFPQCLVYSWNLSAINYHILIENLFDSSCFV